jgi:sugar lactone lactonase YvrE
VPAAAVLAAAACSDDAEAGPTVSRTVVGDTTIVRVAGAAPVHTAEREVLIGELEGAEEYTFGRIDGMAVAEDGSIYVLDAQASAIRVYAPDGAHVRSFGRSGEGPGELKQPAGMAFLSDGRLLVRDPGNARINVYSPTGESLTTWPIPGGFFTSAPIYVDRDDNVYTDVIAERRENGSWNVGLLRLDREGQVVDTLRRPHADYDPPALTAQRVSGSSRSMSMSSVPFWPQLITTLNRAGEFVGGITDRYAVQTWHGDGKVTRIERDIEPVPVVAAEADAATERITRNMRGLDESWRWDGPRPPATKPAYTEARVAEDGRLWVRTSQPGELQPPDPDAEPDDKGRMPVEQWLEPMMYDVFEPDGQLAGTVIMPARFRPMVMRDGQVWGVLRDEYDVQYVTRLRALPARPGASPDAADR